jgi:hypothetical protein
LKDSARRTSGGSVGGASVHSETEGGARDGEDGVGGGGGGGGAANVDTFADADEATSTAAAAGVAESSATVGQAAEHSDSSAGAFDAMDVVVATSSADDKASDGHGDGASSVTTVAVSPTKAVEAGSATATSAVVPIKGGLRNADEVQLAAVRSDVKLFFDKIKEGGFGTPPRDPWMRQMESATR